jgi:putative hemolysin
VFLLNLLIILFFILLSGFLAASESALLSAPKSSVKNLAEKGNKAAKIIQDFQKNPELIIATTNVGFIISLIAAAFLTGLIALSDFAPFLLTLEVNIFQDYSNIISIAIGVILLASATIVFSELIPKSLALKFPVPTAITVAYPFLWLSKILKPIVLVLRGLSNLILYQFKDKTSFSEARVSEEEFKLLLEEGRKTGTIDKTEQELITSIFEFTDTTAKEVMIPRTDVIAVNLETKREKLINIVLEEGYSRLPVYSGSIDNILGIVYTKDLISLLEHRDIILLYDILRPAYFVPETKKISQLMRELQQKKIHMAIVIDEFGGTEGIITMEDILEEIVGEIQDEYEEEIKEVESTADGSFFVNARINIAEFNEKFNIEIPESNEYDTISGFLHKITGHIPELNEEIKYQDLHFTIVKKSQRRIKQVKVIRTVQ